MSKKLYEETKIRAIANAIRQKNGSSNTYTTEQMPNAIRDIETPPDLETLSVNQNGNYLPSVGKDGFSSVSVHVQNSYAAGDEGKVVKNQELVSQTSRNITNNGTYDTTENNQVIVNVSGGGGGGGAANILHGVSNPTSAQGSDGDIYLMHSFSGGGLSLLVRYIKFTVNAVQSGSEMQFSEIEFFDDNNNVYTWPSGIQYSSTDTPGYWNGHWQDAGDTIDGLLDTKFYTSIFNPPSEIVYDLGSNALDISVYKHWRWYTAEDTPSRDPVSFALYLSTDGSNWFLVDQRNNIQTTTQRKSVAYTGDLGVDGVITNAYLKANGVWQNLIGSSIDDVNLGS